MKIDQNWLSRMQFNDGGDIIRPKKPRRENLGAVLRHAIADKKPRKRKPIKRG